MSQEKKINELEVFKAILDLLKHITTLSTGSLLLMAAFLDKLFAQPSWKPLVGISFACFIVSIVASVMSMFFVVASEKPQGPAEGRESGLAVGSVIAGFGGFLLGTFFFAVFALRNFYS